MKQRAARGDTATERGHKLTVVLPPRVYHALARVARDDGLRPLASLVRAILTEWVGDRAQKED